MSKNTYMTVQVPRIQKNKNLRREYDKDSLLNILASVPFDKINIPLHSYRSIVHDNDTLTGTRVVGYISNYDVEKDVFDVVIHSAFIPAIQAYQDPIIYPRVSITDGKVTTILGLDICPKMYYSVI